MQLVPIDREGMVQHMWMGQQKEEHIISMAARAMASAQMESKGQGQAYQVMATKTSC